MNNNLSVFLDFKNTIKRRVQRADSDWGIEAKVIYKRGNDTPLDEIMPVYIKINSGKIELHEGEIINSERKIHMEFDTSYDNPVFFFNNGVLEIKGQSHPKYDSHHYEVKIIPL